MLLCRPFFRALVLHLHNGGLGDWLVHRATTLERGMTRWLLGGADLVIVQAETLQSDAVALRARRIAIVPNGIVDPCPDWTPRPAAARRARQVLFLGLGSEDKGLFDAAEAVLAVNRRADTPSMMFVAAGAFPDAATADRFARLANAHSGVIRHAGFVTGAAKAALLRESDCLCLPTRYPHEAQPLVLLEALAHDLPVIASNWRGIAATLPPGTPLCEPGDVSAIADRLASLSVQPSASRSYFLDHFPAERHLQSLAAALTS